MKIAEQYRIEIGNFLVNELRLELAQQGHIATGELLQSVKIGVKNFADGIVIEGRFLKYGIYVDRGRKPGGKKVPIDNLIKWIRVKGLDLRGRSERSVAFMIQRKIHRKGIPSSGDQSKKNWMTKTILKSTPAIIAKVQERSRFIILAEIKNMAERVNKELTVTIS